MASWAATTQQAPLQRQKLSNGITEEGQTIAVVEATGDCGEQDIRARLSPYGAIAWCNSIDHGRYLVRFLRKEALAAVMASLDGNGWLDGSFRITPYSMDHLTPSIQQDSAVGRSESIPTMPTEQLEYLNLLMAEEPNQQQQPQAATPVPYPELQPCNPQWTLASAQDCLDPLEDEVLSLGEANSFISSSGPSSSQLWTQRSIGAVARKDLAKFAALQSMVHQHSNSSTPTPGLMQTSSLGLGSPWGSFTTGSSSLEAGTGVVRRVSSPAGHSASLTPRSNCDSFTGNPSIASALADAGSALQQQLGSGLVGWADNTTQLPVELGLGDQPGTDAGICSEDSAALLRLQQSLLAQQQQQQQQQLQAGLPADTMSLLSAGLLGSLGFAPGDLLGRGLESSSSDTYAALGMTGSIGPGAMPPPPPPPMQHTVLGPPPPPPPARSDGRLSGASSPVPAPPPRALTPGGGQPSWASPAGSPRPAMQQPLSPSNTLRGPPRNGARLFQPGMSNLSHGTLGGLVHQHSYDQASAAAYLSQQQQPLYRVGSPINRGPNGLPPPPPPGLPPPGYMVASAAAAAGGICGSPVPPTSPGVGRHSGFAGIPLPAMASAPAGLLEGLANAAKQATLGGPVLFAAAADTASTSGQAAAGGIHRAAEPRLKADGALFVQELLQLLKAGTTAGNTFLSNLTDLLDCALAAAGGDLSTASTGTTGHQESTEAQAGSSSKQQAMPVDAAAFLGMLQEAAAPLNAAAAAGAAAAAARGSSSQQSSRRGSHRASDSSDSGDGGSSLAALSKQAQLGEAGKALKPIRTSVPGGDSSDLDNTPPALLLRHLMRGTSGSPAVFFPLHPRTTTSGSHGSSSSSCGGAAPGTPHGTPMLLVPQTLPELLSARAALIRLMDSAHSFVKSPAYSKLATRLDGVAAVYDSMHDDPVTVKRRKCKEMAAMREIVKQDQAFTQAVASVSSLRNHIYSLSRKVLIGYGHVEGLPVDLLLGGLTTELAAILTDPNAQPQVGSLAASHDISSAAAGGQQGGDAGPQSCLGQPVADFFASCLPLPKLALLVFVEIVSVDPSPCCMTPAPGTTGCATAATSEAGSCVAPATNTMSSSGNHSAASRPSNLRDRRSSANSNAEGLSHGGSGGDNRESSAPHTVKRSGSYRHSKDGESNGHHSESRAGSQSQNNTSRNSSFNSSACGETKQRQSRRSQQCEFDLVAEAKELEAAASAAAPLVAAAVCDLPAGRSSKRGSNPGV